MGPRGARLGLHSRGVWDAPNLRAVAEDRHQLGRFLSAQDPVYRAVLAELRAGEKVSHWMWFIFPQVEGLGRSQMARLFAIASQAEAAAYAEHPVLGLRLRECTRLILQAKGRPIEAILGGIDAMKFRSSMTLFARVAADNQPFLEALDEFFQGGEDPLTLERIQSKEFQEGGRGTESRL